MAKETPKKKSHTGLVIGGLAAAAAVGGYYLYHSKDAQKKLKNIKGWMIKAKGEVLERIEKLKDVNEEAYHKVIDAVMARYKKAHISAAELSQVTKELKSHWKTIHQEMSASGKKVSAVVRSVVKGATSGAKKGPAKKSAASKK